MRTLAAVFAVAVAILCEPDVPCRCEERPLAEYFADADEVAVGRLLEASAQTSASGAASTLLRFELVGPLYKSTRSGSMRRGESVVYRTGGTTAECGVEARVDGLYVLFARTTATGDADGSVDTCTGTRILLAAGMDEPAGFVNVPPRFVMQQINGLAGIDVLAAVVENSPDESGDANEHLIGLLDVSSFSHAGFARLHAEPRATAPLVAEVNGYEGLETKESGYEEPAAIVLGLRDGWYRLRLADGRTGWLPPDQSGTYHRYPEIVINRLNYVPTPWHGFVWPSAGAGLPVRITDQPGQSERPVEVVERVDIGGFPWLRVNVLAESPCEAPDPKIVASGWIPAWGLGGEPTVWFYSRGC